MARQLSGQGRLMGMKVMYRHADNNTTLGKARGFQLVGPEAMRQQEAFLQGEAQLDVNLGSWTQQKSWRILSNELSSVTFRR